MSRRTLLKASALGALTLMASSIMSMAQAADTIKVGLIMTMTGQ